MVLSCPARTPQDWDLEVLSRPARAPQDNVFAHSTSVECVSVFACSTSVGHVSYVVSNNTMFMSVYACCTSVEHGSYVMSNSTMYKSNHIMSLSNCTMYQSNWSGNVSHVLSHGKMPVCKLIAVLKMSTKISLDILYKMFVFLTTSEKVEFRSIPWIIELYIKILLNFHELLSTTQYQKRNVSFTCQRLKLLLIQNTFQKHDFAVYAKRTWQSHYLQSTYPIFNIAIFYHVYAFHYSLQPFYISPTSNVIMSERLIGGGPNTFSAEELQPMFSKNLEKNTCYKFKAYVKYSETIESEYTCVFALKLLIDRLTLAELKIIASFHGIVYVKKISISALRQTLHNHVCGETCDIHMCIFEKIDTTTKVKKAKADNLEAVKKYQQKQGENYKAANLESVKKNQEKQGDKYKAAHLEAVKKNQDKQGDEYQAAHLESVKKNQEKQGDNYKAANLEAVKKYQVKMSEPSFPPSPPFSELQHTIVSDFCHDMSPSQFIESACAVCGQLTCNRDLQHLSDADLDLDILIREGVTQEERKHSDDLIQSLEGPVLIENPQCICKSCYNSISKGKMPLLALANGGWLGEVPSVLSDLNFAEQLLVARVRHNCCLVRVSSGLHKMRANAVTFANPTPKVYEKLPPHKSEMDEVLAFIYTGPCKQTKADFERTPLLVRHRKVTAALEWLILNHCDYYDLEISRENLESYDENEPPVIVDYRQSTSNKNTESIAVNDMELEDGTESGMCPFVVHGLTGEEYSTKSLKALKAIALQHLTTDGKILAVGHAKQPESIYNNPQLFPQMMPWLFPYGLGGIGNSLQHGRISDIAYKKHLLMYHDKRFQKDSHFPLIAFNHEQIKESTSGGYLLAEKPKFDEISKRLMNVDLSVLNHLSQEMEKGERVVPDTDEEKLCFQLIKDLEHVGGHVKGSLTSKKYMRNEIWALISFLGAPSWFITFSPADIMHPLCLYFADTQEMFKPELRNYDERYRLIANNPVAGARFFHFMCEMFIKHILGVGQDHSGIYGDTAAYYGSVEQQGRLALHLHMLLYLRGSLTPQEIRDRIMDPTSDFQQKIVEYLESVHIGEFMTGTMADVKASVDKETAENKDYQDPTQTLPDAPPPPCKNEICEECSACERLNTWWGKFKHIVDDLILRSNVHNCGKNRSSGEKAQKRDKPTCINKQGKCKARYPRPLFEQTEVDPKTGALNMKKGEPWINTFTPIVTYLLRCNTDVTSLLSGTAFKAIVAYISDYVTKPGLKTYTIFDTIRSIFDRNSEMLSGSLERKEKARRLMIQIVNSLTSKMEIGGPMASLYLLGNPDHYTNMEFVTVYWKSYVREVFSSWRSAKEWKDQAPEKVIVQKSNFKYVGFSAVHDYMYRPDIFADITLHEWVQMAKRCKVVKKKKHDILTDAPDELDLIGHDDITVQPKTSDTKPDEVQLDDELDKTDTDTDELNIGNEDSPIEDVKIEEPEESEVETTKNRHAFLKDHPLYKTQQIQFNKKKRD